MWCRGAVVGMVNRSLAKARNAEWVAVYRQRPIQPVP